jgi:hypothetical protein
MLITPHQYENKLCSACGTKKGNQKRAKKMKRLNQRMDRLTGISDGVSKNIRTAASGTRMKLKAVDRACVRFATLQRKWRQKKEDERRTNQRLEELQKNRFFFDGVEKELAEEARIEDEEDDDEGDNDNMDEA